LKLAKIRAAAVVAFFAWSHIPIAQPDAQAQDASPDEELIVGA
jgi:hypothetical protein